MNPTVRLLNVDVHDVTMDDLLAVRRGLIMTIHVDMLAKLQKDRSLYDLVPEFDIITCDSQILCWGARFLGTPLRSRVSGSDFFPLFYERHRDDPSVTIFLLGAMGDIAEQAMANINAKVGREIVVGAYGPPLTWRDDPEEIERMVKLVNESGASVLVVGMSAGPQEHFIVGHRGDMPGVELILPLGGTIDYEAGAVVRPPAWITNIGLEWFWRLAREPRRRWRRYILHQPPVLWHLTRQRLGRYRNPFA
jgi:N-acetylglucosaminyldiphosphoundecaprenol N-acetyl-beta-D-mannosaminyltransferase